MVPSQVDATLPEPAAFAHAVRARGPGDGTWCEACTVREVEAHQAGRDFEREAPYRRLSDAELWAAFMSRCEELTEVGGY